MWHSSLSLTSALFYIGDGYASISHWTLENKTFYDEQRQREREHNKIEALLSMYTLSIVESIL